MFVRVHEPRLRRALVAAYGPADGSDASASALAFAWERWDRVKVLDNPAGYLYRVGQTSLRRKREGRLELPDPPVSEPLVEPGLAAALRSLTVRQRSAVVLVHGFGWTQEEVAGMLEVSVSTVRNHLRRGMAKVRKALEVKIGG